MFATVFLHVSCLLALGISAISDWKHEKFNAVIPISALLANTALLFLTDLQLGIGFSLIMLLMGILNITETTRPGDLYLSTVYGIAFSEIQAFFTLLTVTGVYLYAYPKIFSEKEWIPFAPVFLTCYLLQLASTLL